MSSFNFNDDVSLCIKCTSWNMYGMSLDPSKITRIYHYIQISIQSHLDHILYSPVSILHPCKHMLIFCLKTQLAKIHLEYFNNKEIICLYFDVQLIHYNVLWTHVKDWDWLHVKWQHPLSILYVCISEYCPGNLPKPEPLDTRKFHSLSSLFLLYRKLCIFAWVLSLLRRYFQYF